MAGSRPPHQISPPVIPPGTALDGNPARQRRQVWKLTNPKAQKKRHALFKKRRLANKVSREEEAAYYRYLTLLAFGKGGG